MIGGGRGTAGTTKSLSFEAAFRARERTPQRPVEDGRCRERCVPVAGPRAGAVPACAGVGAIVPKSGRGGSRIGDDGVERFRCGDTFIPSLLRLVSSPKMSEAHREVVDGSSAGVLARWVHRSHPYILPVLGASSLALGISGVLDASAPWRDYAPLVLVTLGVAGLAAGLARLAIPGAPSASDGIETETRLRESWVVCPSCSARTLEGEPSSPTGPWRSSGASGPSTGPSSSAATGRADPGDALWASWAVEAGHLPVERIGPVPETAYAPHREGAPSLYEEGELIVLTPASSNLPADGISSTALEGRDGVSHESLTSTSIPKSETTRASIPSYWNAFSPPGRGPPALGSTVDDLVRWEALNPIPPHLRTDAKRGRDVANEPPSGPREPEAIAACANDHVSARIPMSERPCPECLRPLCASCADDPLGEHTERRCARCEDLHELDAIRDGIARRTSRPTPTPAKGSRRPRSEK